VILRLLRPGVAEDSREDPEKGGDPGGEENTDGDERREKVCEKECGRAECGGGRAGGGVDEAKLLVQYRREEVDEVLGDGVTFAAEAEGLQDQDYDESKEGPKEDEEGEESCRS